MNPSLSCIILSAGYGTRLRPLTYFKPKALVKVNGTPVIDYVIANLREAKIHKYFVNLHYKYRQVIKHIGPYALYFYEPKLLGTAGTIKALLPYQSEDFVVCNADTITTLDIETMYNLHLKRKNIATVAWSNEGGRGRCTGTMIFNREIFNVLPDTGMIDDVLKDIRFTKYFSPENKHWDIGTWGKLRKAQKEIK